MTERAARVFFWVATLASVAMFLAATWDTHRRFDALTHADRLDEHVVAGKRAFERYNCNDCHTILGFGAYYAPDLTRVHARLGTAALERRLRHPEEAFARSWRKMPQQHPSDAEVADLVAYFAWVGEIDNNDWPPQDSAAHWQRSTQRMLAAAALSPAAALVEQEDCLGCHTLGNAGAREAPRLEWIGSRRSAPWIADYLASPTTLDPGSSMPAFDHLTSEQRASIGQLVVAVAARREEVVR
jgi:nitric oxide reductase subunit C